MNFSPAQRQIASAKWPAISTETRIDYVPPPPPDWVKTPPPTLDPNNPVAKRHIHMHLFTIEAKDIIMGYCPEFDILLISDHIPAHFPTEHQ